MPDISLLQQEYYGMQEEESRIQGIVSTVALVLLLIVIGGFVTLYVYNQILAKKSAELSENIKNVHVGEVTDAINELKKLGTQAKTLKELREAHTAPTQLFVAFEKATHPEVFFEDATIDVAAKKIKTKGFAPTTAVLARQVEIYQNDDSIASFTVDYVGYVKKPATSFQVTMDIKK